MIPHWDKSFFNDFLFNFKTAAGLGPDNHLIALRKMSDVHKNTIPALFREKSFKEYINFRLSTSQLVSCEDMLVGYGPVVPDGYGVCYLPRGEFIHFCISSFVSSPETSSSEFFGKTIESSLNQMKELSRKLHDEQIWKIIFSGFFLLLNRQTDRFSLRNFYEIFFFLS